jgi:hypothetical protein
MAHLTKTQRHSATGMLHADMTSYAVKHAMNCHYSTNSLIQKILQQTGKVAYRQRRGPAHGKNAIQYDVRHQLVHDSMPI